MYVFTSVMRFEFRLRGSNTTIKNLKALVTVVHTLTHYVALGDYYSSTSD